MEQLRIMMKMDKKGTTAYNLIEAAKKVGFDARGYKCESLEKIKCPSIAHVIIDKMYHHFVIVDKIDLNKKDIKIVDPALGIKKYSFDDFSKIWTNIIICLYPIRKIENVNTVKNMYKTILKFITPYKKLFIAMFILSAIYTILNILSTFYFKIIIENKTLSTKIYFYLFIFFLSIAIVKLIIDFIRNRLLIYINKKIDKHLMNYTIKRLLSLPSQYFNSRTTGDFISRINDLSYVKELISKMSVILLIDLVLVVGSMIIMAIINVNLFLLTVLILFIYFSIVFSFNNSIKWLIINNQEAEASVSSLLIEMVSGMNTIKNLGVENQFYNKATNVYDKLVEAVYLFNKKYNIAQILKDFISSGGMLAIVYLGSLYISSTTISVGQFIMFYFFLNFFLEPMKNIFEMEPLLKASSSALYRVSDFLKIEDDLETQPVSLIKGNIKIANLNYTYNSVDNVISNFNFDIRCGEKIMINGPSGCGKSTIAKLLSRQLDSESNQITIDDMDINDYSLNAIRENVCYISQDETIFTDSLLNNIVLYREKAIQDVENILKLTYTTEIFERHNLDANMLLEGNGSNISGGERQRIIIARALLKDSSIYIFDESTSEMNISLERNILINIFEICKDKTIIVISHRIDNADLFDRVIRLNNIEKKE